MRQLLNSVQFKVWIFDVQVGQKNRRGRWIW